MKYTWRLHPEEYSLGDTERFYAEMAKKGLRLVKRGTYFSKFEKTEPLDRVYRIELATPGFLDEPDLPEEQVAFYEESGWRLAAAHGLIHVFEAPAMKKFRNRQIGGALFAFGWLFFLLLMGQALGSDKGDLWYELQINWAKATSHFLGLGLLLFDGIINLVWGIIRVTAMTARARQGKPLDRKSHLYSRVFRGFSRLLAAGAVICFLLTLVELTTIRRYDMPAAADGPYMTFAQLGFDGERTTVYSASRTSEVEYARSLLAEIWNAYEAVKLDDQGGVIWMYQDVYTLRSGEEADWLAEALRQDALMAEPEAFHPVEVPGLDQAWAAGIECVARVGDTVWYVRCLGSYSRYEGRDFQIEILQHLGRQFGR